jgi:hypothetical protein
MNDFADDTRVGARRVRKNQLDRLIFRATPA